MLCDSCATQINFTHLTWVSIEYLKSLRASSSYRQRISLNVCISSNQGEVFCQGGSFKSSTPQLLRTSMKVSQILTDGQHYENRGVCRFMIAKCVCLSCSESIHILNAYL